MSRATVATIHLGALRRNLERVRELAAGSKVMAVVKADAYGHGLERVARALLGADAFGVASLGDGLRLRAAGVASRIVVLSGPDEIADLAELRRLQLDAVIHHPSQLQWLQADVDPRPLRVWLKLDTGMHRLGLDAEQFAAAHVVLRERRNVDPEIVSMTHLASSDEFANPATAEQMTRFVEATAGESRPRSIANSAALLGWPQTRGEWLRVGGLLYGLSVIEGKNASEFGFQPAMTLSTKLISVKAIKKGERVGYAGAWQCPRDTLLGTAAIGYGDGYPRNVGAGTPAIVAGARAEIVGRVSMDLITLDLGSASLAKPGDAVVLWGAQLPVEEIARHAQTISYDLTCGITRRVLFVEDQA